jgi:cysteinyl-tRNA synthetase
MITFYNTLTKRKEPFRPLREGEVGIYTCGPTVYDYAHIGNFRTYVFEDILRRFLKSQGYRVTHVMNITDVDDKTIANSRARGMTLEEYTAIYTKAFFDDFDALGIERAEYYPRATAHIPEMVALIRKLMERGHTYESGGSIYFKISTFPQYGALAGLTPALQQAGVRQLRDEYEKEEVQDFALWKAPKEGEPFWETEIGPGRPGWHIECSAMSMKYLGESFDIHAGGVDLVFPHHENEIAQSEAATGKRFVKYWLHSEHLIVDGEKMAKSKGNFFTLRDLLAKGFDATAVRYLLLSVHHRKQLNFTLEGIHQASRALERIENVVNRLSEGPFGEGGGTDLSAGIAGRKQAFYDALADDLNTSEALGEVHMLTTELNAALDGGALGRRDAEAARDFFQSANEILGVLGRRGAAEIPDEVQALAKQRETARKEKNFKLADSLRERVAEMGFTIEDTREGIRIKKKKG